MAEVQVKVPTPLRDLVEGATTLPSFGANVGEVLRRLAGRHPALEKHLLTHEGKLRNFVGVYLNEEDVRNLQREETPVKEGDVLSIVPAIAGGSPGAVPETRSGAAPSSAAPEPAAALTREQLRRYSRHLLLPEVGVAGQKKLRAAKVLLVGAGGLGAPTALYLTAAGIGEIGLVDFDKVELSNLQRQVLYTTADVGQTKLQAATRRLGALNPDVRLTPHEQHLTSENAMEILAPYDLVIDGTDNFPTRYLVNDACVLLGKPNVYGSIYRFEGQASVFDAKVGPCYRCLYPEPPPPGMVPSCAEGGVLGVLPGVIGVIQAIEAIKLILGQGDTLVGRLLLFDALGMHFRELNLRKNPECVLCGPHATQHALIDYPAFCGVSESGTLPIAGQVPSLSVEELSASLAPGGDHPFLLDVRELEEWEIAHLPGATLIPQGELAERVTELAKAREVVVYCRTGARSSMATRMLLDLGFTNVRNLRGGILAWAQKIDPSMPIE